MYVEETIMGVRPLSLVILFLLILLFGIYNWLRTCSTKPYTNYVGFSDSRETIWSSWFCMCVVANSLDLDCWDVCSWFTAWSDISWVSFKKDCCAARAFISDGNEFGYYKQGYRCSREDFSCSYNTQYNHYPWDEHQAHTSKTSESIVCWSNWGWHSFGRSIFQS